LQGDLLDETLFELPEAQMTRLQPFLPKSHGPMLKDMAKPRRSATTGNSGVIEGGLRRDDEGLASEAATPGKAIINGTYLKAHGTTTSLRSRNGDQTTSGAGRSSKVEDQETSGNCFPENGRPEHQAACGHRRGQVRDPLLPD